ncbi:hypothetical protein VNO77_01241 [Canavalia gladiata]|uniref:Uncharacterized protein n=1 Tax=Canavalia gladiata TaxID=3824 RepID=A0AAN9MXE1_CANGL
MEDASINTSSKVFFMHKTEPFLITNLIIMKTLVLSLLLLLAFITKLTSATSASIMIDIDGREVKNERSLLFYKLPVIRRRTFSPRLFNTLETENDTCRYTIARDPTELQYKMPYAIPAPKRVSILSTTVNIRDAFQNPSECGHMPSTWSVVEELNHRWYIKIENLRRRGDGWFNLEPFDEDTRFDKLMFCQRSDLQCGQVGLYYDASEQHFFLIAIFEFHANGINKAII